MIVVHYAEIGIKGKNRKHFEDLLVKNVSNKLGDNLVSYSKQSGMIVFNSTLTDEENISIFSKIPGVAYFAITKQADLELDDIKKKVLELVKDKEFETFKVHTKRSNKQFSIGSMDLSREIGAYIVSELNKKVMMKDFDLSINIDIGNKSAYIYCDKMESMGGLPIGKHKVICLLSGGFDSPVAAYMMMKRGVEVVFVHFWNNNVDSCSVESKVVSLAKRLSKYQNNTKLYMVPFGDIQRQIIAKVPSDLRMLIYRRYMMKIASSIAKDIKIDFLITGDNLSQVASQTYENLFSLYKLSEKPILSPLIGFNKQEIINLAHKIGTYEISKQPYEDCCSFFIAKHPKLNAGPVMIQKNEVVSDELLEKVISEINLSEF